LSPVKAVENAHPVAPVEKALDEHRADVTAAPRDEDEAPWRGRLGSESVPRRITTGQPEIFVGVPTHGRGGYPRRTGAAMYSTEPRRLTYFRHSGTLAHGRRRVRGTALAPRVELVETGP